MTPQEAIQIRLNSQLLVNQSLCNPKDIVSHMGVVQSQDFAWFLKNPLTFILIKGFHLF